jgi:uncharacterized protein (DUF1697 family)
MMGKTMPVYVALLRGINLGGHKRLPMDQLRKLCEGLGFEQVKTYIQSGNVVLKTGKVSAPVLAQRLEKAILKHFGFAVSVVTRTHAEIDQTLRNNPFLKERGIDQQKLHVTFLSEAPALSAVRTLQALTAAPDQSRCVGREIYLYLPNGFSQSSLMKTRWEKELAVVTTTRNWRTVNALHQMCRDCG